MHSVMKKRIEAGTVYGIDIGKSSFHIVMPPASWGTVGGLRLKIACTPYPDGGSSGGVGTIDGQLFRWCLCGVVFGIHPSSGLESRAERV
jgi:hypothetical protein